jgi:glutamine cyclotransferase
MKKKFFIGVFTLVLLVSCNKDKQILNTLNEYNLSMETKGYHFGDKIEIPQKVKEYAKKISINFGDKETSNLTVNPNFFTLGDNIITFNITKMNGDIITQDATINVYSKYSEKNIPYKIVTKYPHSTKNFTEGFYLENNIIYESVGLQGNSKLMKYNLGSITNITEISQPNDIFSEGIAHLKNKIFQLTYQNKKIFIYDKNTFKLLSVFQIPNQMTEGWGLTTDGKHLIASDGTKNLFFLDPNNPSVVVKYISVAGNTKVYDQINELEYYNGFIYANIWHSSYILKINPNTGEVIGKIDLSKITSFILPDKNRENVLNGIAFKGNNMLITGKNWANIYEIEF